MAQQIHFCTTADGVRIAYATAGAGPPLVKAANWLNHLEYDWQSPLWRPLLDGLAQDFRLIRYDERGNGLSDWDVPEFSLEVFVRDLEAVVEAAKLERFPLLGISQGGAVAIAYAVRHPERVSHLILHGAYPRGWARRGSTEEMERRETMLRLIRLGWGQDNPAFRQLWTTLYIPGGTPEQMSWFNEMQRISTSAENAERLFRALSELDVSDLLGQVRTPALVLHSRGDAAVPYAAGRELAARIPGARLVTLESKNHLVLQEEPAFEVFVREIRSFLGAPARPVSPVRAAAATAPVSAAARVALEPGGQLGPFRLVESLGAGGMGVVFRARDTRLERDVALKLLTAELAAHSSAAAMLLNEARAASALNHPNIAHVYEVGEASGHSYIAMEFVEGRPLSERIPAEGLPAEQVLRYGTQVAAAIGHAHDRGIIHRDLKSANVMVTPEGQAKVLDFGLAQRLAPEEVDQATRSRLTLDHGVAGTLAYMAPELFRGSPADARSDIWALGVALYEMAAGKQPFQGRTGYELTSAILRETPPALPPQVPAGLRAVVQRCLAKEPGERYRNAGELRAALEAIGSGTTELTAAVIPAEAATARAWWKRKRIVIPAAAIVVFALALWKGPMRISFDKAPFSISFGKTASEPSGPRTSTGTPASANKEANEYFERGVLLRRASFQPFRAQEMFERALELDPKFAEARAWYSDCQVAVVGGGFSNDNTWIYRAEEEIRKAMADDPNVARVYPALARIYLYQGRKELMPEALSRGEALDPQSEELAVWRFYYLFFSGNNSQARAIAEGLVERSPLYWVGHSILGTINLTEGHFDAALRNYQKPLDQDPQNMIATQRLAKTHVVIGQTVAARRILDSLSSEFRSNFVIRLAWALVYAREGRRPQALRELDAEVQKYIELNALYTSEAAEFYALLGEKEKALEWLERAVAKGDERAEWFRRSPLLENIRSEPRFQQILDSIAFRRQQRPAAR
jgi:serine/threonine protein kinase/pimeloyl-ACP methyl ester carboxylesterase